MNKSFARWAAGILAFGLICVFVIFHYGNDYNFGAHYTDADKLALAHKLGMSGPKETITIPALALNHPIRLAIGNLGLKDDSQMGALSDLALADLSNVKGIEPVERRELDKVLREMNLSLSGLVRARDAVNVGKLLHADWFLLGNETQFNGTNAIVVRIVDARTGVLRDAGVVSQNGDLVTLAQNIATFIRTGRENAAHPKPRTYLAIGSFQDLSVNNRQADFPDKLRGYLTAAYRGSDVILLERQEVETLLNEVHLDMASLTDSSSSNTTPLQSAFWLVTGQYQSYETTNKEVELDLTIQHIFSTRQYALVRGESGETIGVKAKQAIDTAITNKSGFIAPTRTTEILALLAAGREQDGTDFRKNGDQFGFIPTLRTPEQVEQNRRNVQEAIKIYESVLLLDPTNREARIRIAQCLRTPGVMQLDKARDIYRKILDENTKDNWATMAERGLYESFSEPTYRTYLDRAARLKWWTAAEAQTPNPGAAAFFKSQAEIVRGEIATAVRGSPKSDEMAEADLFREIRAANDSIHGKPVSTDDSYGIQYFMSRFGTNQAMAMQRLMELLPKMIQEAPDLKPNILAEMLTHQPGTNSPLLAEFEKSLAQIKEQPKQVLGSKRFGMDLDNLFRWAYTNKEYGLAVHFMESKLQIMPPPTGPADILVNPAADRLALSYAYAAQKNWQMALTVMETLSNAPFVVLLNGPWDNYKGGGNTTIIPSLDADICRKKLGIPVTHDPREFDLEKEYFEFPLPSAFSVDESGLWIAMDGEVLSLDFDCKTNFTLRLPGGRFSPVTSMAVNDSKVWIGTDGDGLFELDKKTRVCTRKTQKDGMLMDHIGSLLFTRDVLWIGYGRGRYIEEYTRAGFGGGLGKMDLNSSKFSSFTTSFADQKKPAGEKPPKLPITMMVEDANGDICFGIDDRIGPFRRYKTQENSWENLKFRLCTAIAGNAQELFLAQNSSQYGGSTGGLLGVSIFNFQQNKWRELLGFPETTANAATFIKPDGDNLWVGGLGYVALVDPQHNKLLKFSRIQAQSVWQMEIAGGYLWTVYNGYLHRAPLPTTN